MATTTRLKAPGSYQDMVWESGNDFKVRTQIYTDPEVFDDEMKNIFEKTWVYVGHASQVAHPGDYHTSWIGKTPVVITRDHDGLLHVLLNECRHRGNAVVRQEKGNSSCLRCPYHDWIYSNSGELISLSFPRGYPEGAPTDIGGLIQARMGTYRGLISPA